MSSYKEIVTKAVIGKGKKTFTTKNTKSVENSPSTILGCWVINHQFKGTKQNDSVIIDGSYDVNIWYSYDNDTKTEVLKEHNTYQEIVNVRRREDADSDQEEIIVRSLKQPNCVKADIDGNNINYVIEKELGIELVGDLKVKIQIDEEEDPWDEIVESQEVMDKEIDNEVKEDFIDENVIKDNNEVI